jgi:hypothetical protein
VSLEPQIIIKNYGICIPGGSLRPDDPNPLIKKLRNTLRLSWRPNRLGYRSRIPGFGIMHEPPRTMKTIIIAEMSL